jgi:hypothetical protein
VSDKHIHHYRYTIDVSELGYAELMKLVMRYGTGTGEGGSTSVDLRRDIAMATPRTIHACDTTDWNSNGSSE